MLLLSVTYELVVDTLDAERSLETLTLPGKISDGILSTVRRDLNGTIWRQMGRQVFLVADQGVAPDAADELRFVSTVEPTPIEGEYDAHGSLSLRTTTALGYFLRPSEDQSGFETKILYRKEILEAEPDAPLEGRGISYELYDKVAYFSVECYDGLDWYTDWDSELRIETEELELYGTEETDTGVQRVGAPRTSASNLAAAPGVDPDEELGGNTVLPPAAVPVAVRVEIGVYVTSAGRVVTDEQGNPRVEVSSTTVEIPTAQRIAISGQADELGPDGMPMEGGDGGAPGVRTNQANRFFPNEDGNGGGGTGRRRPPGLRTGRTGTGPGLNNLRGGTVGAGRR